MLTKLVNPGDAIELTALDRTARKQDKERKVYASKVYDIISDDQVEILMPMEQSKLLLLPVGGEYRMCFFTQNGLYQCSCRVVDRYKTNGIYSLLVEVTSDLQKRQRREYYRYACLLKMRARALVEGERTALEYDKDYIEEELPTRKATIVDISGGGLRFVGANQYEVGEYIYIAYELPFQGRNKRIELIGRVLTSRAIENQPGEYEHRVQYARISRDFREQIIRYIFEEERKNLKKEKG